MIKKLGGAINCLKMLSLTAMVLVAADGASAQFTFSGDYDRSFGAPNGYFVEAQNNFPADTVNPARRTYLFTGDYAADGSVIAGGRIERSNGGDFWLRKFTISGAPDASFGGGMGYVKTVFSTEFNGLEGDSLPTVLKRQPDGKIVFGGICNVQRDQANSNANINFGVDWCLVRYNADGSIDSGFGNNIVQWSNGPNITYSQAVGPGRVATQTNTRDSGLLGGTGLSAQLSDLAIQPDGKIVAVGYTRSEVNPSSTFRIEGIVVRYNANGSIDTTFGTNGIARFVPSNSGTAGSPCYGERRFFGIRLQPDGRIIAVGHDGVGVVNGGCSAGGTFFLVTRWSSNGTLETTRRLDGNTNVFAKENAVSALITNDGSKLLVSGSYQGTEALVRLNLSDLTVDSTFGTAGVVNYPGTGPETNRMYIKGIQPDGKILGVDYSTLYQVFRLNPNGSPDNSFGNQLFSFMNSSVKGRADLPVFTVNQSAPINVGHILLRPDGRFNLIGNGTANLGGNSPRALVSQNNGYLRGGVNSDFDGDGKTDLSIFRPGPGEWWYSKSSNGGNTALQFGAGTDRITPGDFTGDGKTDFAFFRPSTGFWFVLRSEDNSFYSFPFGANGDVPTPGDFDGDGKADAAVFRPSTLTWYISRSSGGTTITTFGAAGDVPVATDYDGDGKADIAIYRPSLGQWWIQRSSTGVTSAYSFGSSTDKTVPGDYTGDGKSDVAFFRPSTGFWFVIRSEDNSFYSFPFGSSTDVPSPGDYDGDGRLDATVFRPSTVTWYSNRSTAGVLIQAFGAAGDIPVPNAYVR